MAATPPGAQHSSLARRRPHRTPRLLFAGAFSLLLCLASTPATATIFFDFTGIVGACAGACVGLGPGAAFNAELGFFDGTDTSNGAIFTSADIETFSSDIFAGPGTPVTVSSGSNSFGTFGVDVILPPLLLVGATGIVSVVGTNWSAQSSTTMLTQGTEGVWRRGRVPEPGSLALVALALVVGTFARPRGR